LTVNVSALAAAEPDDEARPLEAAEFAGRLARLGPFEASPRLAVAVSGGPDSLALALLAARWAKARGGTAAAITVDHRLRPESAVEADITGRWLRQRDIRHVVLPWTGPKPERGLQAAAREERYALLAAWCRRERILHLLVAHHRDDQLETIAQRRDRGSGRDGRAGMAAVRELEGLRLLRPLLDVPKVRLVRTLKGLAQPWLEDPSNWSPRFARSRHRAGPSLDGLVAEGRRHGRQRHDEEKQRAAWLARHARVDPLGFVLIERGALLEAPPARRWRILRAAIMTAGGRRYPPRSDGLANLCSALARSAAADRTLGGVRILVLNDALIVAREAGAIAGFRQPLVASLQFDGRFRIESPPPAPDLAVGPLGAAGWQVRRRLHSVGTLRALLRAVGEGLPAVFGPEGLVAVPQLGLFDPRHGALASIRVAFRPRHPLAGAPFADPGAMASFASGAR
jgi:tRNA(Ile)-lysidine synthase